MNDFELDYAWDEQECYYVILYKDMPIIENLTEEQAVTFVRIHNLIVHQMQMASEE